MLKKIFSRLFKECVISGCESRGDAHDPYLTRWTLFSLWDWKLRLHHFHRSDHPEYHDHPWPFSSLVLWGGYIEHYPTGKRLRLAGDFVHRPADWAHRVELIKGVPCWTLCLMGPRERTWGFYTKQGWQQWREYFQERGCK